MTSQLNMLMHQYNRLRDLHWKLFNAMQFDQRLKKNKEKTSRLRKLFFQEEDSFLKAVRKLTLAEDYKDLHSCNSICQENGHKNYTPDFAGEPK